MFAHLACLAKLWSKSEVRPTMLLILGKGLKQKVIVIYLLPLKIEMNTLFLLCPLIGTCVI